METLKRLLVKLHLKKPKTFVVRKDGYLIGSHKGATELHVLSLLGISREAHTLEEIK